MPDKKYRAVFISDTHLGFKNANPTYLLEFLKSFECEQLYLVGDIIDGWCFGKSLYWTQKHNDVVQEVMEKAKNGATVYYISGNHDYFVKEFGDLYIGNIVITEQIIHTTADNQQLLVIHGDQFDIVMRHATWLAKIGSKAYEISITCNRHVNRVREFFDLPYWSLSNWLKYKVKKAVNYVSEYERHLTNYAKSKGVKGVVCGHIHFAKIGQVEDMIYLNCGDWVESHTAIVEHYDGKVELIEWNGRNERH